MWLSQGMRSKPEQGVRVGPPAPLGQRALVRKERRRLHEEHRQPAMPTSAMAYWRLRPRRGSGMPAKHARSRPRWRSRCFTAAPAPPPP